MTPEQRAKEVVEGLSHHPDHAKELEDAIANAIRAALTERTEECINIFKYMSQQFM